MNFDKKPNWADMSPVLADKEQVHFAGTLSSVV